MVTTEPNFSTPTRLLEPPRRRSPRRWWIAGALLVVMACVAARIYWGAAGVEAGTPAKPLAPLQSTPDMSDAEARKKMRVFANVNGEEITREQLAEEALLHYGADVIEALMNKSLIIEACRARGIMVTQDEVSSEIDRMAERFGVATDQWLKMLKEERQISPQQYAADIIWPTIALRKLAADRVQPTEQEIQQAYETQFGPRVQARLIVLSDPNKAREVHALAVANPADFGELAKKYSEDISSASAKGLLQPIRKHLGDPELERVAFSLPEGAVSDVIFVNNQYAILKCERHLPGSTDAKSTKGYVSLESVRRVLTDACRDKKVRLAATDVFEQLIRETRFENVFGNPERRKQQPGVAAIVGAKTITIDELIDECIARHGHEALEGTINRRLLEQACRRNNIQITQADLDREVADAAATMGTVKADGSPDVEAWLKKVTAEQKTTVGLYFRDAVWPSTVLRRLAQSKVQVTREDLDRGFEANYGPRKRCRAILFHGNQLRRAQEVWDMARSKPTLEYFCELAEEYSVDASSRTLRGEIAPIQKWGGQPVLEREAFGLKPGEISGVFQMGEKWVILYCEGDTKPVDEKFEHVRSMIHDEVFQKKLRIHMAQEFAALQENATIDNFLAGTSRSPTKGQSIDQIAAPGAPPATKDPEVRPASAAIPAGPRR